MPSSRENLEALLGDFICYLKQLRGEGIEWVRGSRRKEKVETPRLNDKRSPAVKLSGPEAQTELKTLAEQVRRCERCCLSQTRKNVVFGEGGNKKKAMFIGEGPGENEDFQGRPFVGRAGKLLDKILSSIGLDRNDIFITNIVKCHPPGNRDPQPDEVIACWPYLEKQIALLKPRVIVTLGSPATKTLLDTDLGISKLRGIFHDYEGIPLLPTYHPAYLLRAYTLANRKKVWMDMKKLREFLDKECA